MRCEQSLRSWLNVARSVRLIVAPTLAVVSPASAQIVVSSGVIPSQSLTSGTNAPFTVPSVNISAPQSPGNGNASVLLLTNSNATNASSSLTVGAITGENISGPNIFGTLGTVYYSGFGVQAAGAQAVPSQSNAMNGPAITLTSAASLAGNASGTALPSGANWPFTISGGLLAMPGALNAISYGANAWGTYGSSGNDTAGAGGAVTVIQSNGTLGAAPPPAGLGNVTTQPWQPWISGLSAQSIGGVGLQEASSLGSSHNGSGNGGDGGNIIITTNNGATIQLLSTSNNKNALFLNGITALSQGGSNGYNCSENNCNSYDFKNAGWGGTVTVTHNGAIGASGSYGNELVGEIGISATSLGAALACPNNNCSVSNSSGPEQPGGAGTVSVTIGSTGSIILTQGGAIGVLAASASGPTPLSNYNKTEFAGSVSVYNSGVITTGNASAKFSVGVLGISTGSSSLLAPFYTNSLNSSGGSPSGPVSVTNTGTITTAGELAVGIAAISVGGGGIITQTSGSGVNYLGSTGNGNSTGTGMVNVTNTGVIATDGASAFGIVAFSGTVGGLVTADSSAVFNGTPSAVTVSSGLIIGNSGGNNASASGGSVTVSNAGVIVTGDTNNGGNMSIGIVAQSIGGGGGSSGGQGAAAFVGDAGGAGGSGGPVKVGSSGQLTTLNDGAIGILAQSVGGGGGNGGNAKGLFVAVGGNGGSGGAGGPVIVTLYPSQITTSGDFAHGVLEQSIGGGGGNGGYAKAYGEFIATGIGGTGASGGLGGQVTFTNGSSLRTIGEQSYGALLQSVGGGGGNGGAGNTYSAGLLFSASVAVGGSSGTGGAGGTVSATNTGTISTVGPDAIGLLAQSIGGGGGNAGSALAKSLAFGLSGEPEIPTISATVSIGGSGTAPGAGGSVIVINDVGTIATQGNGAIGILAQSVGGGGGNGGDSTAQAHSVEAASPTLTMSVTIGGKGAGGGDGGSVYVTNECLNCSAPGAWITTVGNNATGILAQSIGGGGGNGGTGNTGVGSPNLGGDTGTSVGITYVMGGNGGKGGNGGSVAVLNADAYSFITTAGSGSQGILAQSIGGGGGNGSGGAASGSSAGVRQSMARSAGWLTDA